MCGAINAGAGLLADAIVHHRYSIPVSKPTSMSPQQILPLPAELCLALTFPVSTRSLRVTNAIISSGRMPCCGGSHCKAMCVCRGKNATQWLVVAAGSFQARCSGTSC